MKTLRNISIFLSVAAFVLFGIVYLGTGRMDEGHHDIGSGIWMLGELVRITAVIGIILSFPGVWKRDKYALIALAFSLLAIGLLYSTGWHAFVHHGV